MFVSLHSDFYPTKGCKYFIVKMINKHSTMKNIVKELTEGMQRLCDVANRIVAANGDVSSIERDLLLDDLRRLYDVALQIETKTSEAETKWRGATVGMPEADNREQVLVATRAALSVEVPMPEHEVTKVEAAVPPVVVPVPEPVPAPAPEPERQPSMEELEDNGNSLLFDEVIIEPVAEPQPMPEPVVEVAPAPEPEPAVEEPAPEPEPIVEAPAPEPEPVVEVPAPEPEPVKPAPAPVEHHEAGRTAAEERLVRKVDDLRTVININDKFSFMSDLFRNNMKAYNDFIMHLNGLTLRDEALAYVAEVAEQYKWDNDSVTVRTFYKIFDKKF